MPASEKPTHERTHCTAANSGLFRNCWSGVQLIEQSLSLLQIARVKPFGKPTVDRSEKLPSSRLPWSRQSRAMLIRYDCSLWDRVSI
jgi:hypothetical protein